MAFQMKHGNEQYKAGDGGEVLNISLLAQQIWIIIIII